MIYYIIEPSVIYKSICDEHLLIGTGEKYANELSTRQLNSTGVFFWSLLEKQMELEEMIEAASKQYNVEKERIRPGLIRFLEELVDCGFLKMEYREQ